MNDWIFFLISLKQCKGFSKWKNCSNQWLVYKQWLYKMYNQWILILYGDISKLKFYK